MDFLKMGSRNLLHKKASLFWNFPAGEANLLKLFIFLPKATRAETNLPKLLSLALNLKPSWEKFEVICSSLIKEAI